MLTISETRLAIPFQFGAVTLTLLCFIFAAPYVSARQTSIDSTRSAWISEHLIDVSQSPADAPDEWHKLLDVLRPARLIAFGEATHGDGSAFALRGQILEILHKQLDVNHLLLEALGMFSEPATIDSGMANLWSNSEQAYPALSNAVTNPNLNVVGLDVVHRQGDELMSRVKSALQRATVPHEQWNEISGALARTFGSPFASVPDSMKNIIRTRVPQWSVLLHEAGEQQAAMILDNAMGATLTAWDRDFTPRDVQMGHNVRHLADRARPHERLAMWAASSHAIRMLPAVDNLNPDWSYDDSWSTGDRISEEMGDRYYVISFVACGGSYGAEHIGLSEKPVPDPAPGSLEWLVCSADFESAAFLDLRGLSSHDEGRWLYSPLLSGVLGYNQKLASWPLVLDGLIVHRVMKPSIPRKKPKN